MKSPEHAPSFEKAENLEETLGQNLEELLQLAKSRGLSDEEAKDFIKDWLTQFLEKRIKEGKDTI